MRKHRLVRRQTSPLSSATLAERSDGNRGLIRQFGDVIVPVASSGTAPPPRAGLQREFNIAGSRTDYRGRTAEGQGAVHSAGKGECIRGASEEQVS